MKWKKFTPSKSIYFFDTNFDFVSPYKVIYKSSMGNQENLFHRVNNHIATKHIIYTFNAEHCINMLLKIPNHNIMHIRSFGFDDANNIIKLNCI